MRRSTPPRLRPGLTDRTDAQLLRLAREGDPLAYEAIVARYREPLRRSCARISPDRAEDAVQQALLSAWMALERGAEVRELRPWLYSIARNAAIDQARGVRAEQVELGPEVPGGEDPAVAEARRREVTEVLEAVAALPERQRRALVDTALHGRATEAVAVDLGLSGGALRQLVHRARTTVRAAVPSVAFPLPGWLAEFLGEEGMRRGAVLLSSGSGAAIIAKTTATVATVGAVVAGGVSLDQGALRTSTSTASAAVSTRATASPAQQQPARSSAATLLAGASLLPVRREIASTGGAVGATTEPADGPPAGSGRHDRDRADRPAAAAPESFELEDESRLRDGRDRRRDGWAPESDDETGSADHRRRASGSRDRDRARSRDDGAAQATGPGADADDDASHRRPSSGSDADGAPAPEHTADAAPSAQARDDESSGDVTTASTSTSTDRPRSDGPRDIPEDAPSTE